MMQRICPVCDQVMKHAHYCSACRSWVKEPVYMNVTYYLNERHPEHEAHCSYHNGDPDQTNTVPVRQNTMLRELGNTEKRSKKKNVPNQPRRTATARSNASGNRNQSTQTAWQTGAGKPEQTKPAVKKTNPIKILVLLYFAIVVLSWLVGLAGSLANAVWFF